MALTDWRPYDTVSTYGYRQFLGEDPRSATSKLARRFLLHLARKLGMALCYRCGCPIADDDGYDIDHVEDWIGGDPALFWDLDNLRLSHSSCNRRSQRRVLSRIGPDGTLRCTACAAFKEPSEFSPVKTGTYGRAGECRECGAIRRRRARSG